MVLGFLVTPWVLRILGKDTWGLWAASGALLAYAGLADFGVLSVLQWVIADADGRKDHDRIRASLSSALPFACLTGVGYLLVACLLWQFYPDVLHLSPLDQSTLTGPVFVVVLLTAVTFPLRLFSVLLVGLQDATFLGVLGLIEVLQSSLLTFVLSWRGFGLYSLAIGMALPPVLSAVAMLIRANVSFRPLLRNWPKPTRTLMRSLGSDGVATWLGSLGFQLAVAADPIILAHWGLREAVSGFVLTSRLPTTLMHFGWILPNAALVGLAQLSAEGNQTRTREVVLAILRLHLILSGAVASAVLAANGGFIRVWVGADLFLGPTVNALMAGSVLMTSAMTAVLGTSCVWGKRMSAAIVIVANGSLHILVAPLLARKIGVAGVAAATVLSAALTLPFGLRLLALQTGVKSREIVTQVVWPWVCRFTPLALIAYAIGRFSLGMSFALLTVACSAFGIAYLFWMKPLYIGVPLGPRLSGWLSKLRLLPPSAT
jgi:O-antigen/teichoic acid export membrane protein